MRLEHCYKIMDWWNDRHEIITKDEDGNVVDEKSRCFTAAELVGKSCNFDYCKFPKEDEEILPPAELLADYHRRREALIKSIDSSIEDIEKILYQDDNIKSSGMTVKCLNELADLMTTLPDRLRKSILQEAIQGRLVPQNADDEPASELLKKIRKENENLVKQGKLKKKDFEIKPITEDEKPFEIPESWKWVRLKEITYNQGQKEPKNMFSYIDIGSINNKCHILNDKENLVEAKNAPSRARKIIVEGDIIYSTVRPYLHNMAIINKKISCEPIASTGFAVLSCHVGIFNKFLFYYLMSPEFDNYANDGDNAKGIAYPAINDDKLYKSVIPLPPLAEQRRIVEKICFLR